MTVGPPVSSALHDRMVFVVGAPRSGTTWLQRMLSVHPDVIVLPSETHLFSVGLSQLRDQTQGHLLHSGSTATWFMTDVEFNAAARRFADAAFSSYVQRVRPAAARIVERSPSHVWHLGLIADVYPDAWVLHIVRDGRDVARSQVAQSWGPSELEHAARQWASSVHAARAAAPRIPRYLEVRYEDLLAKPAAIRDVFEFLDLAVDDDDLDVAVIESGRIVNVDPTRPDVAEGKWRQEWTPEHVATFEAAAGDALDLMGYPRLPSLLPAQTPPAVDRDRRRARDRRRPVRPTRPAVFRPAPERWQETVTAVVGALADADSAAATTLFAPDIAFSADGAVGRWSGDGAAATAALQAYLTKTGPWGEVMRGDQHIDGRTWSILLTHSQGEALTDRMLLITVGADATVERLEIRQFPLGSPTS